jgi:2-keto-4-pentenoate hydratase/2-oxohepta-3-ene-1,7-dioic acid hydratase in catechol pathway
LNYIDHAKETGSPIPENPIVFFKAETCIVGANDAIMLPRDSTHTDWEVELCIVIGQDGALRRQKGRAQVCGRLLHRQRRVGARLPVETRRVPVGKRQGLRHLRPLGPWMVTVDEIKDPQNLDMWLEVNGVRKQTGNTRTMIFGVADLVADTSKYMTLLPGDLITTGTPPGVGMGMKPNPQYLKAR